MKKNSRPKIQSRLFEPQNNIKLPGEMWGFCRTRQRVGRRAGQRTRRSYRGCRRRLRWTLPEGVATRCGSRRNRRRPWPGRTSPWPERAIEAAEDEAKGGVLGRERREEEEWARNVEGGRAKSRESGADNWIDRGGDGVGLHVFIYARGLVRF